MAADLDDQVDALLLFLDWFAENEPYLRPMVFCEPIIFRQSNPLPWQRHRGCAIGERVRRIRRYPQERVDPSATPRVDRQFPDTAPNFDFNSLIGRC